MMMINSSKNLVRNTNWSLDFFKATFLVLSLFLIFYTSWPIMFAISSLILMVLLIRAYKLILLSLLLFLIVLLINYLTSPLPLNVLLNQEVRVAHLSSQGPIFIINGSKILIKTAQTFNVGDVLYVKGLVINLSDENIIKHAQNYHLKNININYLFGLHIQNIMIPEKIAMIKAHDSLYIWFKNYLQSYPLIAWFLLGVKFKKYHYLYKMIMQLNVAHIFVISGFHVGLIKNTVQKIIDYCKIHQTIGSLLSLVIVWMMCYVLDFNTSILRASLLLTLQIINKYFFKNKWHIINLWCVIFLIVFVLWPYHIFALNFILTFMTSLTLYLTNHFMKRKRMSTMVNRHVNWSPQLFNYLWQSCLPLLNVYLVSLPLIIFVNGNYNLCGFFINIILSPMIIFFQFLTCAFLWSPLVLNFLTNIILNWCQFCNLMSLIIDVTYFNANNLLFIYTFLLNLYILDQQFLNYKTLLLQERVRD